MLYRLSIEFAIDLNSASSAISKHLSKHLSKHSKTIRTEVTGAMEIKQELEGGLLVRERTFEVFDEHLITFCLFKMPGRTFLLWIGNQCEQKRQQLSNLCLAINGSATTIVGNEANSVAVNSLSARLGEKFNDRAPIYLSYNLSGAAYASKQFMMRVEELANEFLREPSK